MIESWVGLDIKWGGGELGLFYFTNPIALVLKTVFLVRFKCGLIKKGIKFPLSICYKIKCSDNLFLALD